MQRYFDDIKNGVLLPDPHQEQAVARLERCYSRLLAGEVTTASKNRIQRFLRRFWPVSEDKTPAKSLGCYLWGGVGRGKTHIMDYFYDAIVQHRPAKRIHFHRFMREIHQQLHQMASTVNPLDVIAKEYAAAFDVICLDEFVVIDITDAMLLGGLTQALFRHEVVMITTSNVSPNNLYKDGLQRARFLPTIAQLEYHLDIVHLDAAHDYRLRHLVQHQAYHVVAEPEAGFKLLLSSYQSLTRQAPADGALDVNHRMIAYQAMHNDIIWFKFDQICGNLRSVADYIELAKKFKTVLLGGVPVFDQASEAQARRFVHLVDEFYDNQIIILMTARAPIHQLYQGEKLAFEFERTQSRLIEMQSQEYLNGI